MWTLCATRLCKSKSSIPLSKRIFILTKKESLILNFNKTTFLNTLPRSRSKISKRRQTRILTTIQIFHPKFATATVLTLILPQRTKSITKLWHYSCTWSCGTRRPIWTRSCKEKLAQTAPLPPWPTYNFSRHLRCKK